MSDTLHDDLVQQFRGIADRVVPPVDGRHRITVRLAQRRRRRRRARVGAASLVVLAASLTAVHLDRDGDTQMATRSGGVVEEPTTTAPGEQGVPLPASEPLPRLAIDHPEYPPVGFVEQDTEAEPRPLQHGAYHLQSFRPGAQEWGLPMVFVYTTIDESYGIGDRSPPDLVTTVDVDGSTGYLVENASLGWRLPDGTAAFVLAPGLGAEPLVEFGRSLQLRADGRGWEAPEPPQGLVPVVDEALVDVTRWRSQEVDYGAPPDQESFSPISVRTLAVTPASFEALVADRTQRAENIRTVTVRGAPAAVITLEGETTVIWAEHAGTVAHEVRLTDAARDHLDELLASLVRLDERSWDDLVAEARRR